MSGFALWLRREMPMPPIFFWNRIPASSAKQPTRFSSNPIWRRATSASNPAIWSRRAASFIRNAMTDLVRDSFSQYEQRMVDSENGLGLQKVRLDEVLPGEERLLRMEAVADITAKSPEQVYEEKETLRELYEGLGQISEREQTYLLYRHGFTDDVGHTLIGTAIHFHLSESRAKKLEDEAMDNLWLELPWWF